MRWFLFGVFIASLTYIVIDNIWPNYTNADLVQDIRTLHKKAFPEPNWAPDPTVTALNTEIKEVHKQLVLTVQDIHMLLANDQFLKGKFDALTELVEELHPFDEPNVPTEAHEPIIPKGETPHEEAENSQEQVSQTIVQ